ncbi:hypothetical protein M9H77_03402 [Catharanthus roseus]|uniref:Uncharacterized protein n=1 Tax=Catharanthus roseus TaxID=4058 RepID=A0ACC0CB42_CATRO|nr:hypothetical protein M9H77_03402 [Catharanthus roseus]
MVPTAGNATMPLLVAAVGAPAGDSIGLSPANTALREAVATRIMNSFSNQSDGHPTTKFDYSSQRHRRYVTDRSPMRKELEGKVSQFRQEYWREKARHKTTRGTEGNCRRYHKILNLGSKNRKIETPILLQTAFFVFNDFQQQLETGQQQRGPNKLCEFGLSMRNEGQPWTVLPVKNIVNPLANRWPQETVLSNSLSAKAPFPLTAVTQAVTRRLTGTDQ